MNPIDTAASRILSMIEAVYIPTHDYQEVSPEDFSHLDLRYYDSCLRTLEDHGYRLLADFEDVTLSNMPNNALARIMIRSMLSADGTIMAAAYHPRMRFVPRLLFFLSGRAAPAKVVDFETEYSDGAFLATTNAACAANMTPPPWILAEYLPAGTPVETVLNRHLERMTAYESVCPTARPMSFRNKEDVRKSQNRMNAIKAAHRREIGGVALEELQRLSSGREEIARRVHERIQQRRA